MTLLRTLIRNTIANILFLRDLVVSHLEYLLFNVNNEKLIDCTNAVESIGGTKYIDTATQQVIVSLYEKAQIVDNNLIPSNIVNGVTILGVLGNYNLLPATVTDITYIWGGAVLPYPYGLISGGRYRVGFKLIENTNRTLWPWNVKKNVTIMGVTGYGDAMQCNLSTASNVMMIDQLESIGLFSQNIPYDIATVFMAPGFGEANAGEAILEFWSDPFGWYDPNWGVQLKAWLGSLEAGEIAGGCVVALIIILLEFCPIPLTGVSFTKTGTCLDKSVSFLYDNQIVKYNHNKFGNSVLLDLYIVYGTSFLSAVFDYASADRFLLTYFIIPLRTLMLSGTNEIPPPRPLVVYNIDYGISMFDGSCYMEMDVITRIPMTRDIKYRIRVEADYQLLGGLLQTGVVPIRTYRDSNGKLYLIIYIGPETQYSEAREDAPNPFINFKYYYTNARHEKLGEIDIDDFDRRLMFINREHDIDTDDECIWYLSPNIGGIVYVHNGGSGHEDLAQYDTELIMETALLYNKFENSINS